MSWPKLSVELSGPKSPDRCQSCGKAGNPECDDSEPDAMERWREHDANDQKTNVAVVLCRDCSERIIEKHPRLYGRLDPNQPHPGVMGLCLDCRHRNGVTCLMARFNGGPGVTITTGKPTNVHVQRSPRRLSRWIKIWPGPATACDRREAHVPQLQEDPA